MRTIIKTVVVAACMHGVGVLNTGLSARVVSLTAMVGPLKVSGRFMGTWLGYRAD